MTVCSVAAPNLKSVAEDARRPGRGEKAARFVVGLTDQTFTCAARAHVVTAARRTACTHVSRAMQAAPRRSVFDFTRRLGRRTEAGPRQVLARVRPRIENFGEVRARRAVNRPR